MESDKAIFKYYSSAPNKCVEWNKHVEKKFYHKSIKVLFLTYVLVGNFETISDFTSVTTSVCPLVSHTLDF